MAEVSRAELMHKSETIAEARYKRAFINWQEQVEFQYKHRNEPEIYMFLADDVQEAWDKYVAARSHYQRFGVNYGIELGHPE